MGSVGSGTVLEYVQASYGLDDSFEWFGGTVNAKYLIAYKGTDDDFDCDFGWTGTVQFALGYRDGNLADGSGSNGFEVDNDANGSANAPFTAPTFANVSIIGPRGSNTSFVDLNFQNGLQLRRNNKIKIYNTFVTGYPTGLYIDSQRGSAKANAASGDLVTKNVVIAGTASHGSNGFSTTGTNSNIYGLGVAVSDVEQLSKSVASVSILIGTETPTNWFKAIAGNKILATTANTGISASLWSVTGRPVFTVAAGGTESLIGTALPTLTGTTATDYVGAFKDTDWTATWAEFAPNTVLYLK
jgi:hypothetical protein